MTRDHDVEVRRQKRRWPAQYKLDILTEIDAAKATGIKGAVGAVLRRENLYSSLIADWRKQRDTGALAGLKAAKTGRPAKDRTLSQLADSRRRINELEAELATARQLIKAQGKVSALLQELSRQSADPDSIKPSAR